MAPSPAYYVWIGSGKPFTLMRPARALQAKLQARGLVVYAYPDDDHLKAKIPEDHTPFSATGWPVKSAFGIGHAIDIMPRADTVAGRAEAATIARKLIADRNAGVAGVLWVKYLNWTDEKGVCRQERWTPNHTTTSSTDKGHIHVSGRSDCDNDSRADNYDPLGASMAIELGTTIPGTKTSTVASDRSYSTVISDLYGLRAVLFGERDAMAGTPLAALLGLPAQLQNLAEQPAAVISEEQIDALAERIFAVLAPKFGDVLINALADPRAIEAYRLGANAAEDS
jgi:hypothetical protein